MSTQKENEKKNKYYEITEADFRNGEIVVLQLKDGRHLFALKYGENKDNTAIIALATIDSREDNRITRRTLVNKMHSLKMNPKMRDIESVSDMEETYKDRGFSLTREGKELFSRDKLIDDPEFIPQTVEYNEYEQSLENVNYSEEQLESDKRFAALRNHLNVLQKENPEEFEKFKIGKDNFFKVLELNSKKLPQTYEEAKEAEESLASIPALSKENIIKNMKKDDPEGVYREYLELKEMSLLREKWKTIHDIEKNADSENKVKISEQLKEYIVISQAINEYILTESKQPIEIKEKRDELLEKADVTQENLYVEEIKILLESSDKLKTEFYNDEKNGIKTFLRVMKTFDFDIDYSKYNEEMTEIEIKEKQDVENTESIETRPQGGDERE